MLPIKLQHLPSTDELPCSEDIPVDNEDQNLLPNVLLFLLKTIWAERMDWYFGVVSQTLRGEYGEKMEIYARLGVLYYLVYNHPELWGQKRPKKHQAFEVYKLVEGEYRLQQGDPYWMPEVGLGIGRVQVMSDNEFQEQLGWFDEQGDRYLTADERAELERQQKELEQQRAERLAKRLRELGEDPDRLL